MTEEQAAQHLTRARDHWNCEVAGDREVTGGHSSMRRVVAVSWILFYIVQPDHALAAECRAKKFRGARHRVAGKMAGIYARQRVEHVRAAFSVDHVIEKSAEFRPCQLRCRIGHGLHNLMEVELTRYQLAYATKRLGFFRYG